MATAAHWHNWIYRTERRHWHAFWCRWSPDLELTAQFKAERIFEPLESGDGCRMQVIYHYGDERGTVSEGPTSGPWTMTAEECATDAGIIHPSSKQMTTLVLPGGPGAWCFPDAKAGQPCAVELFLHHGESLRMSAGITHAPDGSLKQLALIREDTSGWPSAGWSESLAARGVESAAACLAALGLAAAPAGGGRGHSILAAGLQQEALAGVPWGRTLLGQAGEGYVFMLCDEDRVAIVGRRQREPGAPFGGAAVWRPEGGSVLYCVEAWWEADGPLREVRHLVWADEEQ